MRRSSFCLLAVAAVLTIGADDCPPPRDNIITVETTVPGIAADGLCSLAEAIENSNGGDVHADCEPGTVGRNRVVLGSELTYTLTEPFDEGYGLPEITGNVRILGGKSVIQRAEGSPEFGLLRSTSQLEFDHVTVRNAAGEAAVSTSGWLVIRGSKIESSDVGIAMLDSARLEIASSTVRGNRTGIVTECGWPSPGNFQVSINGTTVSNNRPGGGIVFRGCIDGSRLTLTNSTFSSNGAGRGGAISVVDGRLTMSHCTVVLNTGYYEGGGIYAETSDVWVGRSIITNNQGLNCSITEDSVIASGGHNITDDDWCGFDDATDMHVTDPMLSDLAYWGGPTLTFMPLEGSPAIDMVVSDWPIRRDQRYYLRPADGDEDDIPLSDCGAVEVGAAFGYPPRTPPQQHLHWGIPVEPKPTPPFG